VKVISYRITLCEPVILTALEGDPNQSVSLNYIPGSVLRGAIIGKYMHENNLKTLNAADEKVRKLFFEETTRYLNGYPVDRLGKRTLSVPLSWHQDKQAVAEQDENSYAPIYDFAVDDHPDEIDHAVSVKVTFFSMDEDEVRLVSPIRRLSIHTARNRRYGRAIKTLDTMAEPLGAVYRYEALEADQTFEALILCDSDEDAEFLMELLKVEKDKKSEVYFLGGSRSAGYGRVKIQDVKLVNKDWREAGGKLKNAGNQLVVMFLSDVLLRDENGQYTADPIVVTNILKRKLNLELNQEKVFMNTKIVGGFNRKWGLPLPQSLATGMGSVFIYSIKDPRRLDLNKLRELEEEGIGERRIDGFGRLAFNCLEKSKLSVEEKYDSGDVIFPQIRDKESIEIAKLMVTRMFEKHLEDKIVKEVIKKGDSLAGEDIKNLAKNAQINRLRNIIHNISLDKDNPDVKQLEEYIKNIKKRSSVVTQFEKTKIENKPLLDWIEETLNKVKFEQWLELFGYRKSQIQNLGGVKPDIDESFRYRYLLRYIDAVLTYALKKKRKEGN